MHCFDMRKYIYIWNRAFIMGHVEIAGIEAEVKVQTSSIVLNRQVDRSTERPPFCHLLNHLPVAAFTPDVSIMYMLAY